MDKKIIIARYNEDVSWASQIDFAEVIIYNKGKDEVPGAIALPNVGRESGAYLHFIIQNYDLIHPDTLYLFLQGNPFEHQISFADLQKCIFPQYFGLRKKEFASGISNRHFPMGFPGAEFCDMIFLENPFEKEYIEIRYGANFCASGRHIKKRCKQFYQFLSMYLQTINPIEGHIMERIWSFILFSSIKDKITEYGKRRKIFLRGAHWNGIKID